MIAYIGLYTPGWTGGIDVTYGWYPDIPPVREVREQPERIPWPLKLGTVRRAIKPMAVPVIRCATVRAQSRRHSGLPRGSSR
jgi:hypothetical protein